VRVHALSSAPPVRVDMRKTRRHHGDASIPASLFGLDELERGGKKKGQKKCTSKSDTSPQPTSVATESLRESGGALGREMVEGEEAVHTTRDMVQTAILSTEKTASITKLTKVQWRQVTQVKMLDHWGDDPEVVSFKIEQPTVADPYYFWVYWDTPKGREGFDRCGWQVADMNRFLLGGKLLFKCANDKEFTTSFVHGASLLFRTLCISMPITSSLLVTLT
jgi:hypothetical protein